MTHKQSVSVQAPGNARALSGASSGDITCYKSILKHPAQTWFKLGESASRHANQTKLAFVCCGPVCRLKRKDRVTLVTIISLKPNCSVGLKDIKPGLPVFSKGHPFPSGLNSYAAIVVKPML